MSGALCGDQGKRRRREGPPQACAGTLLPGFYCLMGRQGFGEVGGGGQRRMAPDKLALTASEYRAAAQKACSPSCAMCEDTACQLTGGSGRDRSWQDVHSSHRSGKAMLQPCVHHRRRRQPFLSRGVLQSEAPCPSDEWTDLFSTSDVALAYFVGAFGCLGRGEKVRT
uniref:Uncharacterized protein n=1 Tax=Knipowitschia caucasica TaxID=637954 RepID=A0AAV2L3K8_KNICA